MKRTFLATLRNHIPPGQLGRYLLVGSWNTAFGYLAYAALTAILSPAIPFAYLAASLLASLLNITMAFFLHKHFVFQTKGNYLREWARCLVVYSSGIALNLALLPVIVRLISYWTRYGRQAPYLAGALVAGFGVVYNFFGHKKFSFQGGAQNSC